MEKYRYRIYVKTLLFGIVLASFSCNSESSYEKESDKITSNEAKEEVVLNITYKIPEDQFHPEKIKAIYEMVQWSNMFPDSKTFADASLKTSVQEVLEAYDTAVKSSAFDTLAFINQHFNIPTNHPVLKIKKEKDITKHLYNLWPALTRQPDQADLKKTSTIIPLPNPYVIPGGRFREIYYWDSYFTMIGLLESGQKEIAINMVNNFAHLINTIGFIPNGNRSYYLTRSQPPFFALMVDLVAEGDREFKKKYLKEIRKEYDFWMKDNYNIDTTYFAKNHVVQLEYGEFLNRYFDVGNEPRPEGYKEDLALNEKVGAVKGLSLYPDIRSACESGWDFSTRWFDDQKEIKTITTTNILPVDLNCLLYFYEKSLANLYKETGDNENGTEFSSRSVARKDVINKYLWNEEDQMFYDYNFKTKKHTKHINLASAFPLYFRLADKNQAESVHKIIKDQLLKPGGFVTTTVHSGEQWDAPNGWAPLQWITIKGLNNYGFKETAIDGASRWVKLNEDTYARTGKMLEKYNVEDLTLESGGGEYPTQDGFGWTNGVYLGLKKFLED